VVRTNHRDDTPLDDTPTSDLPARLLDDRRHRAELRDRYYGLLQELRVVLPGVQVLVAFLLTAPFSARFAELDDLGVATYVLALICAVLATICCVAPTVYHRAGGRTTRSARLVWGVRLTRIGLGLLGLSLVSAVYCVTRFVLDNTLALWMSGTTALLLAGAWVGLPALTATPNSDHDAPSGHGGVG
jgi:hypothetical protein